MYLVDSGIFISLLLLTYWYRAAQLMGQNVAITFFSSREILKIVGG
jgi:hypothetical protein